MGRIVAQYQVKAMPKDYTTTETKYSIVQEYMKDDEGKFERDEEGRKIKKGPIQVVSEQVESKGGLLFTFPGGHSIRLTSPEQLKQFGLNENPRLVDLDTGEEVNEHGVPLSLANYVNDVSASGGDFGKADTE